MPVESGKFFPGLDTGHDMKSHCRDKYNDIDTVILAYTEGIDENGSEEGEEKNEAEEEADGSHWTAKIRRENTVWHT